MVGQSIANSEIAFLSDFAAQSDSWILCDAPIAMTLQIPILIGWSGWQQMAASWPWLLTMFVLIVASALFSGSEAALFSLSTRQRRQLSRVGMAGKIADRLLSDPERLLSAVLFWNLLINMTYFAIASIVASRLEVGEFSDAMDPSGTIVFTAASLLAIIFFSEMLPKSIAVLSPMKISLIVSVPLSVAVRIVSPVLPWVKAANLLTGRLIWPSFRKEPEMELSDIERAIELSTDDAALLQRERLALRGIVEMAETRASELMRPRGKLRICTAVEEDWLGSGEPPGGYLMIADESGNNIVEAIGVRLLRPSQMDDLSSVAEPVIYVPWSARVSLVWERLTDEDLRVAVVVDEYGEAIGALTIEQILRHVLAPRRSRFGETHGEFAIESIGEDHYRVLGSVSLRVLVKRLEIDPPDESIATVAGYIQRQNERLPRLGDSATLSDFELMVVDQDNGELKIDVKRVVRHDGEDLEREVKE